MNWLAWLELKYIVPEEGSTSSSAGIPETTNPVVGVYN